MSSLSPFFSRRVSVFWNVLEADQLDDISTHFLPCDCPVGTYEYSEGIPTRATISGQSPSSQLNDDIRESFL